MNYRHIYHAGNFADVLKHIVLVLCLEYLRRKEGGLCLLDAHGGAGLYALDSEEAAKTGEWRKGIGCLEARRDAPADLKLYLDLVAPDLGQRRYPGSPLIMARPPARPGPAGRGGIARANLRGPASRARSVRECPCPAHGRL